MLNIKNISHYLCSPMWFLAAAMWEWICLESSLSWSSCLLSRPNCSREALSIPPRLALLPSICFRLSVRKFCKQKYYFLFEKMKLETRETRVPQFCNCYWQFTSRQKWSRFCHIFLEQSLVWKYCLKLEGCLHNFFLIGPHSAAPLLSQRAHTAHAFESQKPPL